LPFDLKEYNLILPNLTGERADGLNGLNRWALVSPSRWAKLRCNKRNVKPFERSGQLPSEKINRMDKKVLISFMEGLLWYTFRVQGSGLKRFRVLIQAILPHSNPFLHPIPLHYYLTFEPLNVEPLNVEPLNPEPLNP
jgi:hypothetical protein